MSFYVRRGSALYPTDAANLQIEDKLPPGNWTIKVDPMTSQMFFDRIGDFESPPKLYGNAIRNAERIITTFIDRTASTGVLLAGEKGSGKSMLAKELAVRCRKIDMPTIVINAPFHGEKFNQLIQSVDQPAVVLFDEFEKVYDSDEQQSMLTLLDGMYPTKKLFVLTCNDEYRIDSHMRNRPGRLFYSMVFHGLEEAEIRDYCNDRLVNKANLEGVVRLSQLFAAFNFDMLKALVEEMNRFNETAFESFKLLNARPGDSNDRHLTFDITLFNKAGAPLTVVNSEFNGIPCDDAGEKVQVIYEVKRRITEEDGARPRRKNRDFGEHMETEYVTDHERAWFTDKDYDLNKSVKGTHVFTNSEGLTAVFTPRRKFFRDYSVLF